MRSWNGRRLSADLTVVLALVLGVAGLPARGEAGCGCEKPPPPVAAIRPPFASPGDTVTLLAEGMVAGATYVATFRDWDGDELAVEGVAVDKRDFADGVVKTQLAVAAPALAPGPATVAVTPLAGGATLLEVPATDFTMLQASLPLPEAKGQTRASCYSAAVAMDGTVYFPLDISDVAEQMIFTGRAGGYRLTFDPEDVVIYNTQGVTMQLLDPAVVGLYTIDDAPDGEQAGPDAKSWGPTNRSFRMTYDRHEFVTYRDQHLTDPGREPDPTDPDWHLDGTRHYDHDHLVLAIHGLVDQTDPPAPGVTPPFTFRVKRMLANAAGGAENETIQWSAGCETPPVDRSAEVPPPSCGAAPFVGCRQPVRSRATRLQIKDKEKDARDSVAWKWAHGQETATGSFGDPAAEDGMVLCLYDESGNAPALIFEAGVPPNDGCDASSARSCWKGSPRGFSYRKKDGAPAGIAGVVLKPGANGRARVVVKGRGELLALPELPLALPVRAQLQSAIGQCWEATFDAAGVRTNTAMHFHGRAD